MGRLHAMAMANPAPDSNRSTRTTSPSPRSRTGRPSPRTLHLHRQAHPGTNRDRIVDFQKQASDAYVPADALEFPDRTLGRKTQGDRKLKVKSAVPAFFLMGRVEILGDGA